MATLEQFSEGLAQQHGYDTTSPKVQEQIAQTVAGLRESFAGASDDDIIAQAGPQLQEQLASHISGGATPAVESAPVAPPAPEAAQAAPAVESPQATPPIGAKPSMVPISNTAETYKSMIAQQDKDFGAAAEQKIKDQIRNANAINEASRVMSLGLRTNIRPEQAKALDEAYAAQTADNARPYDDWQAKKANFIQKTEQAIKLGQIQGDEVRKQITMLGLEQALNERRDKATLAAAEADPKSATSEAMRQLAKKYSPDLAKNLGDRFEQVTAAQLKAQLPALEKEYLKTLDQQEKSLDRASREKIAAGHDAARLAAAAKKAGAGGAPAPKVGDVLRAQSQVGKLEKEQRGVEDKAQGAQETIALFDQIDGLVKGGLSTGPVVGGDNVVSKAYSFFSDNKQQADQIGAQLVSSMAKTFGAAPSDKESALIREANTVMKLDNPGPALAALKAKFERVVAQSQADAADIEKRKTATLATVGATPEARTPKPSPTSVTPEQFNAQWATLPKGQSLVGPDGKTYTKK